MIVTKEDRMSCSVHLSEDGRSVVILDQRQLPNRELYLELNTVGALCEAIRSLAVRGAPAIGICAGYGMYVLALREQTQDGAALLTALERAGETLISSRPTAVNLAWAVRRMLAAARGEAANGIGSFSIDVDVFQAARAKREPLFALFTVHIETISPPERFFNR